MKTIAKAFSKLCCEFTINANKGLIKAEQACNSMQSRLDNSLKKLDEGAVTAEYAVVLIAATAFATVLIAIAKSDAVQTAIGELVKRALHVS
ncbi:hypothetical protein CG392_04420 [Gardnerella vaginalis]|uniref:DUF4244 domain-containing protein n=1 Tax=Gardnerella piotii TaxID=2792977 RepID=A0ABU5MP60_9BIFI|nr:DUF4244 domain-containing protein [Gardnerella piotii]MDZ7544211.1 DUF4244 domain-containing protein [Gardnerella piotii]MDZ7552422.1 DUF4244 domain-containing protein [Gardnerella piotii]RFT26079.1 hypothetical protein CG392_04420 [Gardnerella vaginalis]